MKGSNSKGNTPRQGATKWRPISQNQANFPCPECGTTFNTSETGSVCPECGQNVKGLGDVGYFYKLMVTDRPRSS